MKRLEKYRRILGVLLSIILFMGGLPIGDFHVHDREEESGHGLVLEVQADWEEPEECEHCGGKIYGDWICSGGTHCGEDSDRTDCYEEWHCAGCFDCIDDETDLCTNCNTCDSCATICEECGEHCSECSDWICGDCGKCMECVGDTFYCKYCDICMECAGGLVCYCQESCGNCGYICESCGEKCFACAEDEMCSECGKICKDCAGDGDWCDNCNKCRDCARYICECGGGCGECTIICECEKNCENCTGLLCNSCGMCYDCVGDGGWCENCNNCGECVDTCICGEGCEECATVCPDCNEKCTNCDEAEICGGCNVCKDCVGGDGNFCDNCETCINCADQICYCGNGCSECAVLCMECAEKCDVCAEDEICHMCGLCKDCAGGDEYFCSNCLTCGECAYVCICGNGCNECSVICIECEEHCENCTDEFCVDCERCLDCAGADTFCYTCMKCADCTTDPCVCGESCAECGIVCPDCGEHCELCYEFFCDDCGVCRECAGEDEWCVECNKCGGCAVLCSGCTLICEECAEHWCEGCSTCNECVNLYCDSCGICEDCADVMCQECGYCSDCAAVICIECGAYCESCAFICEGCERCENCVEICLICDCCMECCEENGCEPITVHNHQYSKGWRYDHTNHWQLCRCGEIGNISGHKDRDKDRVCDICTYRWETSAPKVERLSGLTRYETGYKVADELKEQLGIEQFDAVVVATGKNFADALSGSYLAVVKNAPILLTNGKNDNIATLHSYIKENVKENGIVYILGGEAAVPMGVETISGYTVKRLAGESRYDTNLKILEEAGYEGQDFVVSTGKNFADSLSASAVNLPILLVKAELTAEQKELLSKTSKSTFYIIGGTGAVNELIAEQLDVYGQVERIFGQSRYETSIAVAQKFLKNVDKVILADAKGFPDGLCGGPLAAALKSPLVLTADGKTAAAVSYTAQRGIKNGYVLGGTARISDASAKEIFDMKANQTITLKQQNAIKRCVAAAAHLRCFL